MGIEYIGRLCAGSILVGAVLAIAFLLRGPAWAAGVGAGTLWSVANLYVVRFLIVRHIRPQAEKQHDPRTAGLTLGLALKFPLLYGAGFWLLQAEWFRVEGLVVGFVVPFAVAFLDALRRVVVDRQTS